MSVPEQAVLAHLAANPDGVFPRELREQADWLDKMRRDGLIEMRYAYRGDQHLNAELRFESIQAAAYGGHLGVKVHLTEAGRAAA